METLQNKHFTGERALFKSKDITLQNCVLDNGESHVKESNNVTAINCTFGWKYPFWYGNNLTATNCTLTPEARAAIWYSNNVKFTNVQIQAPKAFRRSTCVTLDNVTFFDASETIWQCSDVKMTNVHAIGNYFAMNCTNVTADNLTIDGNYCFDGAKNVTIHNSVLNSKDSFWNCDNVTVYDTTIKGEYLGWNSRNLTFVNCKIDSLQGLCYVQGLKLINCTLGETNLCFEYCSDIDAQINGTIVSVKNPLSGTIVADGYAEIILDDDTVDHTKTQIITR